MKKNKNKGKIAKALVAQSPQKEGFDRREET